MPDPRQSPRFPSLRPTRRSSSAQRTISTVIIIVILILAVLQYFEENGATPTAEMPATATPQPAAPPSAAPAVVPPSAVPAVVPPSGDSGVTVYFTTPALVYPDVVRQRVIPPHLQAVMDDIAAAEQSIDIAVFEYNLLELADALVAASERGVTVRLALDRESLEDPDDARFAGMLEDAGATISWQDTEAFLHSKFIIIDQRIAWTGSWNMTGNDTYRNNNNLLRMTTPELVADYAHEFSQMHAGFFGNDKEQPSPYGRVALDGGTIRVFFTPRERPRAEIVALLTGARQEIRFMAFSFTSDEIGSAMIERAAAGVEVSGVMEKRNVSGQGSEMELLLNGGVDVLPDGNCYTMHHKVIIIDRRYVVTGSYNFTQRAESVNDENLLIIDIPGFAEQYLAEFERVREQAENPTNCGS